MTEMTEEITARQELAEYLGYYREADVKEKSAKKDKETLKPAVIDLFTEVIESEVPLLRTTVETTADDFDPDLPYDEALEKWRLTHYPDYEVERAVVHPDGTISITLVEDPTSRKFEVVVDGYVFGRTYAMVDSYVDGEGLWFYASDDHNPFRDAIKVETITTYSVDEKKLRAIVSDDPSLLKAAQRYINPGRVQVRMAPIRKAKEEDLT